MRSAHPRCNAALSRALALVRSPAQVMARVARARASRPRAAGPWPVTCDEAAARTIEKMGPNGVDRLRSLEKDELIELHFSVGLNIRNGFGLWDGNHGNQALLDSVTRWRTAAGIWWVDSNPQRRRRASLAIRA